MEIKVGRKRILDPIAAPSLAQEGEWKVYFINKVIYWDVMTALDIHPLWSLLANLKEGVIR